MSGKNLHYYLVKLARVTGWLLFLLVLLFIFSGFVLTEEFGCHRLCRAETALKLHKIFEWPFIVVFSVHSLITIYFAFRRWGWIGKRAKS
jgi:hypothetical protein